MKIIILYCTRQSINLKKKIETQKCIRDNEKKRDEHQSFPVCVCDDEITLDSRLNTHTVWYKEVKVVKKSFHFVLW